MNKPKQEWDAHSIRAEVWRRGKTLTGIAKEQGLYESACRLGLKGISRPGAEAIAKALDIPFRTLFPTLYTRGRHDEERRNSNGRCGEEQKGSGDPDKKLHAA